MLILIISEGTLDIVALSVACPCYVQWLPQDGFLVWYLIAIKKLCGGVILAVLTTKG